MEVIKKRMNVADADGWYLVEPAFRIWKEDFVDEDTGEVVPIDRHEVIAPFGEQLTAISISMLQENGVTDVFVCNKQITGRQQKYMSLWQLECVSRDLLGKDKSDYYIIPKGSPLECETFFREWAELNINGGFTIKKVVPQDFSLVLLPFESEIEDARKKHVGVYFYKAVIKSIEGNSIKVLVRADSVNTVESQVHVKYVQDNPLMDRIAEIKEINIKKFFEEGVNVARYSLGAHNPKITSHLIQTLDSLLPTEMI